MRLKKVLSHPLVNICVFALAVLMLLLSSVGGARAALTYFSENYADRIAMYDIGVSLVENGEAVSWRNYSGKGDGKWQEATGSLLSNLIPEGEKFKVGKEYKEELKVTNSGTINQYVRVSILKYWLDQDGNKVQTLSPALINLHLVNLDSDWLVDESASTSERTVLYYNRLLNSGESTPLFADTITIDSIVVSKVSEEVTTEGEYKLVKVSYDYDGLQFVLEAKVDAVQEHNAEDAILSAWGKKLSVSEGSLSLQEGGSNE